jgi:hypothetical protein
MSPTERPDSILMHPALAGRTLVVRRDRGWAAFDIQPEGGLGDGRPLDSDPTALAWRGGSAR